MIYIDPDEIDVNIKDYQVVEDDLNVDWDMRIPEQGNIAYIRLTPELRDFFKTCQQKHGVIGFEYDFAEGGLNFGLILRKE